MELFNGAGAAPAAATDLIKDSSEANFMADVIDASNEVPVIVDFWAPWCGPCKTLGPALEEAVKAAKGAVRMVKINVDEAQMLAQQLRIQSIPTVYAFSQGRPVDGFQGALPGSELKAFIDRVVKAAGGQAPGNCWPMRWPPPTRCWPKGRPPKPPRPLPPFWKKSRNMPVPGAGWCAPIWRWVIWTRPRRS